MVRISESELNLRTIMNSGQCFRIFVVEESYFATVYDVVAMNKYVRVYHVKSECAYFFNCSKDEWDFWSMYFDLDTNYEKFYAVIMKSDDDFLKSAAEYGNGMRILRQSFWEALISFVISQNNNIPRIKKSIELLCEKFGKPIEKYGTVRYSFPTAKDLENISLDDLSDLGLGYRASYIYGICKRNPALVMPNYEMLLAIPGIGKKVASCIMLFGAYDLTQFPIDTWMRKLLCIYRIKLASCTENFRQVAGENLPPRRKGPPVMGSASRSGWQSVGSVIVVGNRDAILGQNSLQQLSAFQVKV